MSFNDQKLPDDSTMTSMQKAYSTLKPNRQVKAMQQVGSIADYRVEWERITQTLQILLNRAENRCIRQYIRGLVTLNDEDRNELNTLYNTISRIRQNPIILEYVPNSFNGAIREFVREESVLLTQLVELTQSESEIDRQTIIYGIINRRLEALNKIASFWSSTLFG